MMLPINANYDVLLDVRVKIITSNSLELIYTLEERYFQLTPNLLIVKKHFII